MCQCRTYRVLAEWLVVDRYRLPGELFIPYLRALRRKETGKSQLGTHDSAVNICALHMHALSRERLGQELTVPISQEPSLLKLLHLTFL